MMLKKIYQDCHNKSVSLLLIVLRIYFLLQMSLTDN
jgi:hypothetical protein